MSLPWLYNYSEGIRELFGRDYWPYGIEPNRKTLAALTRYAYEQSVCRRKVAVEEMFSPEVRSSFKVCHSPPIFRRVARSAGEMPIFFNRA